jgi:cation transport ATPase
MCLVAVEHYGILWLCLDPNMGYGQEAHAFETSAVLISFVLLGKIDEFSCRSDGRFTEALTQLDPTCQSKTAILVSADGSKATVDVELIHPGDYGQDFARRVIAS